MSACVRAPCRTGYRIALWQNCDANTRNITAPVPRRRNCRSGCPGRFRFHNSCSASSHPTVVQPELSGSVDVRGVRLVRVVDSFAFPALSSSVDCWRPWHAPGISNAQALSTIFTRFPASHPHRTDCRAVCRSLSRYPFRHLVVVTDLQRASLPARRPQACSPLWWPRPAPWPLHRRYCLGDGP